MIEAKTYGKNSVVEIYKDGKRIFSIFEENSGIVLDISKYKSIGKIDFPESNSQKITII